MKRHTFAICAYKESPYLEECIRSVCVQSKNSEVIICTSTPNSYIHGLAEKYRVPLYVNEGESGIVQDWNFAYRKANTDLVTIAHQDDVYAGCYAEKLTQSIRKHPEMLIYFTDYGELRNQKKILCNRLLLIKRVMLFPLRFRKLAGSKFIRRMILAFGSPICCPSVTFHKKLVPDPPFEVHFRSNEDWQAWEKLSRKQGDFVYDPRPLMYHRIHEESETSNILADGIRTKEDMEMFCLFWPEKIAGFLTKVYRNSERSNIL